MTVRLNGSGDGVEGLSADCHLEGLFKRKKEEGIDVFYALGSTGVGTFLYVGRKEKLVKQLVSPHFDRMKEGIGLVCFELNETYLGILEVISKDRALVAYDGATPNELERIV